MCQFRLRQMLFAHITGITVSTSITVPNSLK